MNPVVNKYYFLINIEKISKTKNLVLTKRKLCAIIYKRWFALVAQSVEHLTFNQGVRSSNLRKSTKTLYDSTGLFFYPSQKILSKNAKLPKNVQVAQKIQQNKPLKPDFKRLFLIVFVSNIQKCKSEIKIF